MNLSDKQLEIIRVIVEANPDNTPVDLDQLLERINYRTTKDSMHFSLRALVNHGLIEKIGREKRRDRQRVLIKATVMGQHFLGPRPSIIEPEIRDEDGLLRDIDELLA